MAKQRMPNEVVTVSEADALADQFASQVPMDKRAGLTASMDILEEVVRQQIVGVNAALGNAGPRSRSDSNED